MMQPLAPDVVTIPLNDAASRFFPEDEPVKGPVGKTIHRHRRRIVCVGISCLFFGAVALVAYLCFWLMMAIAVRASGLDFATHDDTVDIINPRGTMETIDHADLLLMDERFRSYEPLTAEELQNGALPWTVASDVRRPRFELDAMERLVREQTDPRHSTCICYAEYGLPYNIVYAAEDDEIMYEPFISQEFADRTVKLRSSCKLDHLIANAMRRGQGEQLTKLRENTVASNSSGIVEYLLRDGRRARRRIDLPLFPCVKHCTAFFVTE